MRNSVFGISDQTRLYVYSATESLANSLKSLNLSKVVTILSLTLYNIYYSKFAKGQNFNFVCRRSCVSDTKTFMIDM